MITGLVGPSLHFCVVSIATIQLFVGTQPHQSYRKHLHSTHAFTYTLPAMGMVMLVFVL